MLKPALLLSVLLLFCLPACKKVTDSADNQIAFPRKLYISEMGAKGTLRVLTANGDITDAALKARFLGAQQSYFNATLAPGDTSSITFVKRDTAVFNASKTRFEAFNTEGLFVFTSPYYSVNINGVNNIVYNFLQYTAQYVPNGDTGYLTKEVYAGHGDYNAITLSVLAYKYVRGPYPSTYQISAGTVYNELNLSANLNLGKNDTLALQGWTVTYRVR